MIFEAWHLFVISVLYLGLLFVIATAAEKKWIPESVVNHPLVYTLSLGVYATSWSFYGSVSLADREGYTFMAVYIGATIAFVASPILLRPILRLIRQYQLSSLADLLAFRYNSQLAGVLVTLFMLTGALPYMALQIQAVTDSLQVLTGVKQSGYMSLIFCLTISLFVMLFGARHITQRDKHQGLVVAIAFESLVKLMALLMVGFYAVFGHFNGFSHFSSWLENNPQATEALMRPIHEGPWATMILLSFSAAFLLPRQFHMIFVENIKPSNLAYASWAFPLFLLLLNISIPPILWAGQSIDLSYGADLYVLGVAMQSQSVVMPVFVFIGGVSAASAMIIVTTIALASMCLNHLVLPIRFSKQQRKEVDIYNLLIWGKRTLVLLIILAGYAFYLFLQIHQELTDLGLISFVAVAQFLPGIFGLLYWRGASRQGFISGLLAGAGLWIMTLILPLFAKAGWLGDSLLTTIMIPMSSTDSAIWTLLLNASIFVTVSIFRPQDEAEKKTAAACYDDSIVPSLAIPYASTVEQIETGLATITGAEMAAKEVKIALQDLGFESTDLDKNELATLRLQIRHNLSGLLGPLLAEMIVSEQLEVDTTAKIAISDTIRFVEKSLQGSRLELKEMESVLDSLRRFHRQVLHDLPLPAVTISTELQIVSWNKAMEKLSHIKEESIVGEQVMDLSEPWSKLLKSFLGSDRSIVRSWTLKGEDNTRILNLFKSAVSSRTDDDDHGHVVLIEDHSEIYILEQELAHSERLASIGRLATGVAHEIGNPITGIACLAQEVQASPNDKQLQITCINDILSLTERITGIVSSLVSFSHADFELDSSPEPINMHQLINESIRLVSLSHKGKQIQFLNHCPKSIVLKGHQQKISQVFVILLSNACDASEAGSIVSINTDINHVYVEFSVVDSGHGIDDKIINKIFEPFFTTKQTGDGTGLGLSLAYNIIKEQGGQVGVNSQLSEGSTFTVRLPQSLRLEQTDND